MDKVLAGKPQVHRTDHQGKSVAEYFDDDVVYQGFRFNVFLKL